MKRTHENNVEKFYAHGSDARSIQEGGYLSFGYWTNDITDYHQAADALVEYFLKSEHPLERGRVLNVACGYGAETVQIYKKLRPEKIVALDITELHVQVAKRLVDSMNLSDRISFEKGDASRMEFPDSSFDYVIGIEGPAHFDTRELFLRKAFDVLKPSGVLLLTDITVNRFEVERSPYDKLLGWFCAKHWYMPKANWMSIPELSDLLRNIGFKVDFAENLGANVYPGFSKFNLRFSSIRNAMRVHGLRIGIALTFISWLLGHAHRRRLIDYVYLRAIKEAPETR